jgi:2-iminobutanoate/2-iminopropanoate deaminase
MADYLTPRMGKNESELPFSLLVQANSFAFVSGQGPVDWDTGAVVEGDIKVQTAKTLENIRKILEAGGLSMRHVVRSNLYITNIADFDAMSEEYVKHFPKPLPARTTVGVAQLWGGIKVEIDVVAVLEPHLWWCKP